MSQGKKPWWQFTGESAGKGASCLFCATGFESVGRLYYPICNEAGMLSSVTPSLKGSPTAGQNRFLGLPLSAEDLPHNLVHRDFWLVEEGKEPFSLSGCSGDGLKAHLGKSRKTKATVEGEPGWFRLTRQDSAGRFEVSATLWCPADSGDMLECMLVEISNLSSRSLRLHPFAVTPLYARSADDLRDHRHVTALLHRCRLVAHGVTVQPTMSFDERGHRFNDNRYTALAFGPSGKAPVGIWPTQESFLGEAGNYAVPQAVWNLEMPPKLKRHQQDGKEALGGFRFAPLRLGRGQKASYLFVSGISNQSQSVAKWTRKFSQPDRGESSLKATRLYWRKKVGRVAFSTGDDSLNNWLTWVGFQPILRHLYGNSFLPEFDYGRGGKGWRDLWQDCLALLLYDPKPVREMLCHNFGGVRIDGSNATIVGHNGEFVADRNNIPRTWMDHGCWPTHAALLYMDQSGDLDFVLQEREYFRDPQVHRCRKQDPTWTEAYGNALRTKEGKVYQGTLLEHMLIQNVTAFFNVGEHNLCRLEGADWNDGLDLASDRGESVAFSAFYAWNLERLAKLVHDLAQRGHKHVELVAEFSCMLDRLPGQKRVNYRSARAKQKRSESFLSAVENDISGRRIRVSVTDLVKDLSAKSLDLAQRIADQEWIQLDARHKCFNGYYDNQGERVEGPHAKGARMTLTGQVFPVMMGVASEKQIDEIIKSVRKHLRDPAHGGVRLNTDFGELQPDLGRAFSFNYGEKENGAVFSHMAVMYSYALYQRRRAREAREVWHALYGMAMDISESKIFPCVPEYFNADGRGMYCYLTGSASWLIYLLLTQVYGVRGELGNLVLDPQLTSDDFGGDNVSVDTSFAGRDLTIRYQNPDGADAGSYEIAEVRTGRRRLTFSPRPGGGVCIPRSEIEALPVSQRTMVAVMLGCLR